jgi:AsmA protein
MRRSVKWTIAVAAVAAMLAGVYRWPMASARVGGELNRAMPPIGLHWRGPARVTFALLPWPTLRVIGVDLVAADGHNVLTASEARFPLSIFALMGGHFVPVGAALDNPTALVDLDAAPALAEERAVAEDSHGGDSGAWEHIRLRGGILHVVSASRHLDTLIESLDGGLDWPSADAPLRVALVGAWRDEHITISGRIDSPSDALSRRATGVALSIASRPLEFDADGVWGRHGETSFVGTLTAEIRSLSTLERLLGGDGAPFALGDSFSLSGKAQAAGEALALSDAEVTASGQKFDGALNFARQGGRYAVSGTLAANQLDLAALIGPPPDFVTRAGDWSQTPFAFAPPTDLDLDLRLSAARLAWRDDAVADAAGSLMCKAGACTATLLEANAYQGTLKGQLSVARGARGLTTLATVSLADADLGAAFAEFGWRGFQGRGDVEADWRTTGFAASDSILSLAGRANATLTAGSIDGVSVEDALRRSQRRAIDVARDLGDGATHFLRGRMRLTIANGAATIDEGHIEGPGSTIDIGGMIDIVNRSWQAQARAVQTDSQGAPSADAARLTIILSGPWSAPNVSVAPGG